MKYWELSFGGVRTPVFISYTRRSKFASSSSSSGLSSSSSSSSSGLSSSSSSSSSRLSSSSSSSSRLSSSSQDLVFYNCPSCKVVIDMDNEACNTYHHAKEKGGCGKCFCAHCGFVGESTSDVYETLCWPDFGPEKCKTMLQFPNHKCNKCIKYFCEGVSCVRGDCTHKYKRPATFTCITRSTLSV